MEIGVVIANTGNQTENNLEIQLTVYPKVGKVILAQGIPDLPIHQETHRSAKWTAPILFGTNQIPRIRPQQELEVTFANIQLGTILKHYLAKDLWPVELKAEASIVSQGPKKAVLGKKFRRTLRVKMWE